MSSLEDKSNNHIFPEGSFELDNALRNIFFLLGLRKLITIFVNLDLKSASVSSSTLAKINSFLLLFKISNQINYSIGFQYIVSPRIAKQLKWWKTIIYLAAMERILHTCTWNKPFCIES